MKGKTKNYRVDPTEARVPIAIDKGASTRAVKVPPVSTLSSIPPELYITDDATGDVLFPVVAPDGDEQPIYLTEALSRLLQMRKIKSSAAVRRRLQESIGLRDDDDDWSAVSDPSVEPERLISMLEKSAESLDLMDLAFDSFDICLQECHRQLMRSSPRHAIFIDKLRRHMAEFWSDSFSIAKLERQMATHYLLSMEKRERDMLQARLSRDELLQSLREKLVDKDETIRLLEVDKACDKQVVVVETTEDADGANKLLSGMMTSTVLETGENHLYKMEVKPGSNALIALNKQSTGPEQQSHLILIGSFETPPCISTPRKDLYVAKEFKRGHCTLEISTNSLHGRATYYAMVCCVSETDVHEKVSYTISHQMSARKDEVIKAIGVGYDNAKTRAVVAAKSEAVQTMETSATWEMKLSEEHLATVSGDDRLVHTQLEHFCSYLSSRPLEGAIWPISLVIDVVWLFWTQKTELLREHDDVILQMGMNTWVYQWFLYYFGSANFAIRMLNTFIQSMHYHLPQFNMQSKYFLATAFGTACGIFGSGSKFYRMEYEEFVCSAFDVVFSCTKIAPSSTAEITRDQANQVVNFVFGVDSKNKESYKEGMLQSLKNYEMLHKSSTILVDTFLQMLMQEWERYRAHTLEAIQFVIVDTLHIALGVCQGVGDLSLILQQVCSNSLCEQRVAAMFVDAMDPRTLEVSASSVVELIHYYKLLRPADEKRLVVPLCKMTPQVDMKLLHLTHKIITACIESSKGACEDSFNPSPHPDSSTQIVDQAASSGTTLKITERLLSQAQEDMRHVTEDNAAATWALMVKLSRLLPLQVYANETKITSSARLGMLATLNY